MKINYTIVFALMSTVLWAQQPSNFWKSVSESEIILPQQSVKQVNATEYKALELDIAALRASLRNAPKENVASTNGSRLLLELPMPDGSMELLHVVQSPTMEPALAEKYPNIRSYKAVGLYDQTTTARLDISAQDFHAIIVKNGQVSLIDPYATKQGQYYFVYNESKIIEEGSQQACGSNETASLQDYTRQIGANYRGNAPLGLRTYRIAISCTGEFALRIGATTKEEVLAFMNTAVNRLNEVYENEVGMRFLLIGANDALIYLNPATDPFINYDVAGLLLDENELLFDARLQIPLSTYEIGHLFTAGCSDAGGIASLGSACSGARARGVSCFSPFENLNTATIRIFPHEVGHQFSATHTYSDCGDNAPTTSTAFEMGCGLTVMSYSSGNTLIPLLHSISQAQIKSFSNFVNNNGCGTELTATNNPPAVSLSYSDGFTIPIKTPFELTAAGSDPDGDPITYSWEQWDADPDFPLFRIFQPVTSPTRVFPRMETIVNNTTSPQEQLPDTTRNMSFVCTVRDNNADVGAFAQAEVNFKATYQAGPFLVKYPNEDTTIWKAGTYAEVKWDVANTNLSPVNCQRVNIKLSTDGGFTYPHSLATAVANTGATVVVIPPNVATTQARVRVEAADNIFFDISNKNFQITAPTEASFIIDALPRFAPSICAYGTVQIEVRPTAVLNFTGPISLDLEGLPTGVSYAFSKNVILADETATLSMTFEATTDGIFDMNVKATSNGIIRIIPVRIQVFSYDFSDLALVTPTEGLSDVGLSTTFSWTKSKDADRYDFELSNNPAFGSTNILSVKNLLDTSYVPPIFFEPNQLFFWRIRPIKDECGTGEFTEPFTFHTSSIECTPAQTTTRVNISGTGLPTVNSTITVPTAGIISDVNIPLIKANYQPVKSLRFSLISPAGTEVVLYDQNCGNTIKFETGFDDESPLAIVCPPDDRLVTRPLQALSKFVGENTAGIWTLRTKVVTAGFGSGGAIDEWKIEFCATISPNDPFVVKNDTLFVPPGLTNTLTPNELEVQDTDNSPIQLLYTLVTLPKHGALLKNGATLQQGATFSQQEVNNFQLQYKHDSSDATADSFTFVVVDGTGGWLPTQRFNIVIDENATVATDEVLNENNVRVFPNPTSDLLNVQFDKAPKERLFVSIFNAQGQELLRRQFDNTESGIQFSMADLASGMYFVALRTQNAILTRKVSVLK